MATGKMRHFGLEDWVDLARDAAPGEQAKAMQRHLEEGCKPCKDLLVMWGRVMAIARRGLMYAPPESVVRQIKAQGGVYRRRPGLGRVAEVARLVFDSFRQPLAEGVRGRGRPARQLLYRSGDLWIDLRMEPPFSDRIYLTGQVMAATQPRKGVPKVPITLWLEREALTRTTSNRFGEFHLQFETGHDLELSVGGAENPILVPLRVVGTQGLQPSGP